MTKYDFLKALRENLSGYPALEIDKSIAYYAEIIADRIEDGETEQEAVSALGDPAVIAAEIKRQIPLTTLIKTRVSEGAHKISNSENTALWIVVLVLGFPIWFTLLAVACALVIAVYAVIFALLLAMYAIVFALFLVGVIFVPLSIYMFVSFGVPQGFFMLATGLVSLGLGMLCFYPVILASKQVFKATAWIAKSIKSIFVTKIGKKRTDNRQTNTEGDM